MNRPKFLFGDIVVIDEDYIGVILKTWEDSNTDGFGYDVYDRMTNQIETYYENEIDRYRIRHKYLDEEELSYQNM
jgi:hypothetical protein